MTDSTRALRPAAEHDGRDTHLRPSQTWQPERLTRTEQHDEPFPITRICACGHTVQAITFADTQPEWDKHRARCKQAKASTRKPKQHAKAGFILDTDLETNIARTRAAGGHTWQDDT